MVVEGHLDDPHMRWEGGRLYHRMSVQTFLLPRHAVGRRVAFLKRDLACTILLPTTCWDTPLLMFHHRLCNLLILLTHLLWHLHRSLVCLRRTCHSRGSKSLQLLLSTISRLDSLIMYKCRSQLPPLQGLR